MTRNRENKISDVMLVSSFEYALNDSTYSKIEYGPAGPAAQIDRSGRRTEMMYDSFGRQTSVSDPASRTTQFQYNLAGDLTKLTDANSNETQWAYDNEGRAIRKIYADNSSYVYQYDANGQLVSRKDAKSQTTNYSNDSMGNLTTINYPTDTDISFTYDAFGNRLTMTDAVGTTTWNYDEFGRLIGEDGPFQNDEISYTYDSAGRRASLECGTGVPPVFRIEYTYDSAGRIETIAANGTNFTYSYLNASNQILTLSRNVSSEALAQEDDAEVVRNTYDSLGRLIKKENFADLAALREESYSYNNSDERTSIQFVIPNSSFIIDYSYDLAGQLTGAIRKFTDGFTDYSYNYSYNYDPSGNPLNRTTQGQSRTYEFNSLNQFLSVSGPDSTDVTGTIRPMSVEPVVTVNGRSATVDANGNWVVNVPLVQGQNTITTEVRDKFNRRASGTRTITLMPPPVFEHDPNGNMTGDGEWVNVFDDADRIVSQIRENDTKIEFVYDGIGRRRIKKTYNWSGTGWVLDREYRFTYEQWLMIGESVFDAQGTVVDEKIYTWGLDLSGAVGGAGGVGGLLAVKDNSGTYYPYFDANGNVIAYTDINGVPVAEYEYSPFGEIVKKSGSKANDFNFRFSTQYYDSETELYSFIFRYYSPRYTRWLSREPLGEAGSINLYGYVYNSPIDLYDVWGLFPDGRRSAMQKAVNNAKDAERLYREGKITTHERDFLRKMAADDLANARNLPKGHSDLTGGNEFDFTKEDHGKTGPYRDPKRHFQSLQEAQGKVNEAITKCDEEEFKRAMHRGQDDPSHFRKGYRWEPIKTHYGPYAGPQPNFGAKDWGLGHAPSSALHTISFGYWGENPDADEEAWEDAENWTKKQYADWHRNCCKCGDKWNPRSTGPCDK